MANPNVLEFNESNFKAQVLESPVPVLVDFWAEWCMPCRMLSPIIDSVANEFAGRVRVGKVDTDSNQNLSVQYRIGAIPTVLIFKGGQVVKSYFGLVSKDELSAGVRDIASAGAAR